MAQTQKDVMKSVGEYMLILKEKLGSGSFGNVYYGFKKTSPETPLAIKMIRVNQSNINLLSISIKREITILQSLNNKNIVKFYDAIITSNNIYMIYEFCDGGDLDKLRCKSASTDYLSEAQTIIFTKHIVNGLKDLFQRKIIHRDLKPANILMHEGYCKIADFGSARHYEIADFLIMTQGTGTPKYMCPEIFASGKYDQKCDVWSFGIMVYELLYGKTPWTGKNQWDLFIEHIFKEKLEFPKIPKRSIKMKNFIQRMLVIDPKDRIGLDEVCAIVFSFDEIERGLIEKKEEGYSEITKPVKRNKKKPVIGDLNNDDLSEDFAKKIEYIEPLEEKNEKVKYLEKTNQLLKDTKLEIQMVTLLNKKQIKAERKEYAKKFKDSIFFFRNFSNFFSNCNYLLSLIYAKKQLGIDENLFFNIYYLFNRNENDYMKKAQKSINELEELNLLSFIELNRMKQDLFSNGEELESSIKKETITNFKEDLQVCLKILLKNHVFDLFFEFEEVLESKDVYDQDFFKFVKFCCLIVKSQNVEEIIGEMKKEIKEQQFYMFYDKYDNMETEEFILDIKEMLKELKL